MLHAGVYVVFHHCSPRAWFCSRLTWKYRFLSRAALKKVVFLLTVQSIVFLDHSLIYTFALCTNYRALASKQSCTLVRTLKNFGAAVPIFLYDLYSHFKNCFAFWSENSRRGWNFVHTRTSYTLSAIQYLIGFDQKVYIAQPRIVAVHARRARHHIATATYIVNNT